MGTFHHLINNQRKQRPTGKESLYIKGEVSVPVHGKKILTKKARKFHMLIERERTVL